MGDVVQDAPQNESIFQPVTVISTVTENLFEKDIVDEITASLAKSDVYSEAFASTVVVQMPTGTALQHPLAGARISVKDNFQFASIKTTMTNRAFTELYPAESETAEYVKTLLRLGAVIVGKIKDALLRCWREPRGLDRLPMPLQPPRRPVPEPWIQYYWWRSFPRRISLT
ncbi:MAG: hypothetical protein LQ337_008618 [Flavoplaca oasis]|nr:MAG: hypothetical protein LQ337_008618 [Flavoplaca oasis]